MNWSQRDFVRDGVKLHYWQKGADAPIVLLHGITDSGACWGRTADALAENFTVLALDQRGHGKSDAPLEGYSFDEYVADALALLRVNGFSKAIVMGHSFGAVVALNLAAQHPQAVTQLILEDPPLFDFALAEADSILDQRRFESFEWLRALKPLSESELVAHCRAQSPRWSEEECIAWAQSKLQASPRLWEKGGMPIVSAWRAWLATVACSTLLVYGDAALGSLINQARADEVVAMLHQGQAVKIPNAGHSIHRDEYAAFMQALNQFLFTHVTHPR
ncbi:MAG: alpha/beta hydrolase [Chloroflexota bacterium]|nr:MAG: alpha/beta hydrolase [Chloroflexota bacterium]